MPSSWGPSGEPGRPPRRTTSGLQPADLPASARWALEALVEFCRARRLAPVPQWPEQGPGRGLLTVRCWMETLARLYYVRVRPTRAGSPGPSFENLVALHCASSATRERLGPRRFPPPLRQGQGEEGVDFLILLRQAAYPHRVKLSEAEVSPSLRYFPSGSSPTAPSRSCAGCRPWPHPFPRGHPRGERRPPALAHLVGRARGRVFLRAFSCQRGHGNGARRRLRGPGTQAAGDASGSSCHPCASRLGPGNYRAVSPPRGGANGRRPCQEKGGKRIAPPHHLAFVPVSGSGAKLNIKPPVERPSYLLKGANRDVLRAPLDSGNIRLLRVEPFRQCRLR